MVPRVLDQSATGLHQFLLQAGKRPVLDRGQTTEVETVMVSGEFLIRWSGQDLAANGWMKPIVWLPHFQCQDGGKNDNPKVRSGTTMIRRSF
jgi:hypothetical protein